jgi:hypothetical protein
VDRTDVRARDVTITWSYLDLDRTSRWRVQLHPMRTTDDIYRSSNPTCADLDYEPPRTQTQAVNSSLANPFGVASGEFVESDTGRSLSVTFSRVAIAVALADGRSLGGLGFGSYRVCLIAAPLRPRGAVSNVPRVVLSGVFDMGTGTFERETGDWRGEPPADVRAPRFIGSSPATGATQVPTTQRAVSATFDEAIAPATLGQIRVVRQDSGTCTGSGDALAGTMSAGAQATSVVFTAAADWLPGVRYCATAQGQRDAARNEVTPNSWAFTTAVTADLTPPTIVTRVPAADATNVEPGGGTTVQIRFSEPVNAPAGSITVTQVGTATTLAPAIAGSGTDQLVLSFAAPGFLAGTSYEVAVTPQVRDLAGNAAAAPPALSWRFTTRGSTPPPPDGPLDCGPLRAMGGSWQPASLVETIASPSQAWPRIGLDCAGTAHAAWLGNDGGDGVGTLRAASRAAGATDWAANAVLADTRADVGGLLSDIPADLAASPAGRAALVYVDLSGQLVLRRRGAADAAWGEGTVLATGLSRQSRPRVGLDADGNVIVVWSQLGSLYQQAFARRFDASAGNWGPRTEIPATRLGGDTVELAIALAVSGSGDAIVAFRSETGPGGVQILGARYDRSAGAWRSERTLGSPAAGASVDEPFAAIDGNGNATIGWTERVGTSGGSTSIRTVTWFAGGSPLAEPQTPLTLAGYSLMGLVDAPFGSVSHTLALLRAPGSVVVSLRAIRVTGQLSEAAVVTLEDITDFFPDRPARVAAAIDEHGTATIAWHLNTDIRALRWPAGGSPGTPQAIDGSTGFVDEDRRTYLRVAAGNGRATVAWAQQACTAVPCNNATLPMSVFAAQFR